MTRGGKRAGAGRKPGTGKGRTVVTSSINLPPDLWAKLDAIRGEQTRSGWVADRVKKAKCSTEISNDYENRNRTDRRRA